MEQEIEKWQTLTKEISAIPLDKQRQQTDKQGSITIAGSGIKSAGQFTLEAVGHIKNGDKVFYCVADPVSELYIKDLRPDAMDLYVLYNDDKDRYKTYVQMSEILLNEARKGLSVVGIFYGHPGMFVLPSHRAIQIAKKENISCRMLAAPSAEDCLFADLGVDPSFPGCQSLEATDLLLRNRTICTDLHVVIWQVGCVGDLGFRFNGFANDKLDVMIDRLLKVYGPEFELIHYIAPHYPVCEPVKDVMKLKNICDPENRKKIASHSTFYLPPREAKTIDQDMCRKLELPLPAVDPEVLVTDRYSDREKEAIRELEFWKIPQNYKFSVPSALSDHLIKLSFDPRAPQPESLSEEHRKALASKQAGRIQALLRRKRFSDGETTPDEIEGGPTVVVVVIL